MTSSGKITLAFGNEAHTTAWHLKRALERRGLEVVPDGPGHPTATSPTSPVIWVESAARWLPRALGAANPPGSVAWVIDTHRPGRWRGKLPRVVGAVGYAQWVAAHQSPWPDRSHWVPLAAPMDLARPDIELRDRPFDVAFVGQAPPGSRRAAILQALTSVASVYVPRRRISPAEMMEAYGRARVVINIPLAGELNMRAFEAAASRSLLVCGPTADLDRILPGMYRVVHEDDPAAWTRTVCEVLRSDSNQQTADEAHSTVAAAHSYDHRADALLDLIRPSSEPVAARSRALAAVFAELGERGPIADLPLPWAERAAWATAAAAAAAGRSIVRRTPGRWRPGPRF